MAKKKSQKTQTHITPLVINRLRGRMMHADAQKSAKRNILLVYGQHASLERMEAFVEEFSKYGTVTLPDLPGFGGMQSFYTIDKKPTLDNMADYLAAFVKMRYRQRRITIVGVSYGFLVATRMLQRHPDISKKVDLIVSVAGFAHHTDFKFAARNKHALRIGSLLLKNKPMSIVAKFVLVPPLIKLTYWLVRNTHAKMQDADAAERNKRVTFEIRLWRQNDFRTRMFTGHTMLTVNLCNDRVSDSVKLYHIAVQDDQYFNNNLVEEHLHTIYKDTTVLSTKLHAHMPTVVASADEVAPFIPKKLRTILKK